MVERNDIISVIIPVYNVEKYLSKCVDSVLNQTYRKYEIILIDDGSTDKSAEICDDFALKHNNIIVIHQDNSGLSAARNAGIDRSHGEYIAFVDSDDFIGQHFLEHHLYLAKEYNADLVISSLFPYFETEKNLGEKNGKHIRIESKEKVLCDILLQKGIDVSASGKIYRKTIFDEIRFPEGEIYEDFQIIHKVIDECTSIVVSDYAGYFYLQRNDSIMHTKMNKERLSLIRASECLIKYCEEKYSEIEYAAEWRYIISNFQILKISVMDNEFRDTSEILRKNILKKQEFILQSDLFTKKLKISTRLLKFGLTPYKFGRIIYEKLYS